LLSLFVRIITSKQDKKVLDREENMVAKKQKKSYGVKKVEEKYVCEECQHEVPVHQDCPACRKHVDWDRILEEIVR
jgi:hypothetical protein